MATITAVSLRLPMLALISFALFAGLAAGCGGGADRFLQLVQLGEVDGVRVGGGDGALQVGHGAPQVDATGAAGIGQREVAVHEGEVRVERGGTLPEPDGLVGLPVEQQVAQVLRRAGVLGVRLDKSEAAADTGFLVQD